jgi:hypothetical protein
MFKVYGKQGAIDDPHFKPTEKNPMAGSSSSTSPDRSSSSRSSSGHTPSTSSSNAPSNGPRLSAGELNALADRLADHADGIVNVAAHEMEQDIRLAAGVLRHVQDSPPLALLPALQQEIESTAASCSDAVAARRLRKLIGPESDPGTG